MDQDGPVDMPKKPRPPNPNPNPSNTNYDTNTNINIQQQFIPVPAAAAPTVIVTGGYNQKVCGLISWICGIIACCFIGSRTDRLSRTPSPGDSDQVIK